jgi:hypothetical protein
VGAGLTAVLYDPLLGSSSVLDIYGSPLTAGRTFASTTYIGSIPTFPEQVVFCTRGRLINPVRYTVPMFNTPTLDDIVVGKDYSIFNFEEVFNDDVRNTVSCAMGYSATGLVLISSVDGARSYFAWSHFGDWEVLPLPEGIEHMCVPQLVVGMDGRWHVIYKNWHTDQMMCISTE